MLKAPIFTNQKINRLKEEISGIKQEITLAIDILKRIEEGNFTGDDHVTAAQKTIENSQLIELVDKFRKRLRLSAEEEKNRTWAVEGLAKFADILRVGSDDSEIFYAKIISSVVTYLKVLQGGLFIVNDENEGDVFIELAASYAYDRRKFLHKRIEIGEGLVGQCYLEKEPVYLTKIPANYLSIQSGLGASAPNYLMLIPLKSDDKVVGVMELASFHPIKNHEKDFLAKLGESIAGTLINTRINEKTKHLLAISQKQSIELKEQEEELRQNMEEIKSTQEELARQLKESNILKRELEARQNVLDRITIVSESDLHGSIVYANKKLSEVSQYSIEEMIGKPHSLFRHPDMSKQLFKALWTTIKSGKIFRGVIKNRAKDGTHYWVDATIAPVFDENNTIVKYIGVRYVITEESLAESLYYKSLKELGIEL